MRAYERNRFSYLSPWAAVAFKTSFENRKNLALAPDALLDGSRIDMAISDSDAKVLWGRAAGVCSNPNCRRDLTVILEQKGSYNIGEMAHIIARRPKGPRGASAGGSNAYRNLILLCPTCHTTIDKGPEGQYAEAMLHDWKSEHENSIRLAGKERSFESFAGLKAFIKPLLLENHALWSTFWAALKAGAGRSGIQPSHRLDPAKARPNSPYQ